MCVCVVTLLPNVSTILFRSVELVTHHVIPRQLRGDQSKNVICLNSPRYLSLYQHCIEDCIEPLLFFLLMLIHLQYFRYSKSDTTCIISF